MESEIYRISLGLMAVMLLSFSLTLMPFVRKADAISIRLPQIVFPLLGGITFLAIISVKSSLALSLGMVGALSIVRFRTPIKDPLELILLFFTIGVAVGCAADLIKQTLVIAVILLLVANVIFAFTSRQSYLSAGRTILTVETNGEIDLIKITSEIKKYGSYKLLNRAIGNGSDRATFEVYFNSKNVDVSDELTKKILTDNPNFNIEVVNDMLFS